MSGDRKCSAVPEERESKRGICRRLIDALSKGGNNPECRGVVPAGEWKAVPKACPFRDDKDPVSVEAPKGVYKTKRRPD